jgi:hypothetical protein
MAVVRQGINTGLLGYSLKKEYLGESLCFREVQTFTYELYSTDFSNSSPAFIHQTMNNDFRSRYSGDINVKVFEMPADYSFPNDSVHIAKYRVAVEVKSSPSGILTGQGLTGTYYSGIGTDFWSSYGPVLLNMKEDFSFEQSENGNKVFNHDLSFGLLTGTRQVATQVASGIFVKDQDTTFGITAMVNGVFVADTSVYQDFFTEVYDEIRQEYKFTKKREIMSVVGSMAVYSLKHQMEFKEDGTFEISENGDIQGKLSFEQAKLTTDTLIAAAYNRCNLFYTTYSVIGGSSPSQTLLSLPVRTIRSLNQKSFHADYTVSYTNDPHFEANGSSLDQNFEIRSDALNFAEILISENITINRRNTTTTLMDLLVESVGNAPVAAPIFYASQGDLYSANYSTLALTKATMTWPSRNNKVSASYTFSNKPVYNQILNGRLFYYLDVKTQHNKPVDTVNEYKVINRDAKLSIINYTYQTAKGQYIITVEGWLGRSNVSEFLSGFRTNHNLYLEALYKHGISVFMAQFKNVVPTAFTYYLSDFKYSLNQDSVLITTLTFDYTLKKYIK